MDNVKYMKDDQIKIFKEIFFNYFPIYPKQGCVRCEIKPIKFIRELYDICMKNNIIIKDVRLIGGAAGCVVNGEDIMSTIFNDIDFNFIIDGTYDQFHIIRYLVHEAFGKYFKKNLKNIYRTLKESYHLDKELFPEKVSVLDNQLLNCAKINDYFVSLSDEAITKMYLSKMVLIRTNGDMWSLFGFGHGYGNIFDIKFVRYIKREYEFSIDSFQISILPLMTSDSSILKNLKMQNKTSFFPVNDMSEFPDINYMDRRPAEDDGRKSAMPFQVEPNGMILSSRMSLTEDFRNKGSFFSSTSCTEDHQEAILSDDPFFEVDKVIKKMPIYCMAHKICSYVECYRHLKEKVIFTNIVEEIYGGGLLKYCLLLSKDYKLSDKMTPETEKSMCAKFFCDFTKVSGFDEKITTYINLHIQRNMMLQLNFLKHLYYIIRRSASCLYWEIHYKDLDMICNKIYSLEFSFNCHHVNHTFPNYSHLNNIIPPPSYQYIHFNHQSIPGSFMPSQLLQAKHMMAANTVQKTFIAYNNSMISQENQYIREEYNDHAKSGNIRR